MISTIQNIFLPNKNTTAEERIELLSAYTFIGSKVETLTPELNKLHIAAFYLYYQLTHSNDFSRWLINEKYRVHFVEAEILTGAMRDWIENNILTDDFDEMVESIRVNPDRKINAIYAVYSCPLGKGLTPVNFIDWRKKCIKVMLGSVGGEVDGSVLETIYPTYTYAIDFYSTKSSSVQLRAMAFGYLKRMYTSQG